MTHSSTADAIAAALAARLETIRRDNGYHTDAGRHVWHGRLTIDPDNLPAITLFEREDEIESQRVNNSTGGVPVDANVLLPYAIEASAPCDADHPARAGRALVADIKRCIFGGDLTWGGLARLTQYTGRTIATREDGSNIVTVAVFVRIGIVENLAQP